MNASAAPRQDRDSIVRAALEILDKRGLPELTMRALASVLGVQPSALYWHFSSKQELLAAVADRILEDVPSLGPDPLTAVHAVRDALLSHRDSVEVIMSTLALSLGAQSLQERLVLALEAGGYRDAERIATPLLGFLLGHTGIAQQRLQASSLGVIADTADAITVHAQREFDAGARLILSQALHDG